MLNNLFGSGKKSRGPRSEALPEPNEGPPDSSRPQGLCPRCEKQSSFEILGSVPVTVDLDTCGIDPQGRQLRDALDQVTVLACRNCQHGVVVVEEQYIGDHPRREGLKKGGSISWRGIHWWPVPGTHLSSDVPKPIAAAFGEATGTYYARCYRACAVMARRTLEAICDDKGQGTGPLASRLKAMAGSGVLQPTLADWATEVRLLGNVGAHFDPLDDVSTSDADALLAFTRELIRYLYELPAELFRRRNPQP